MEAKDAMVYKADVALPNGGTHSIEVVVPPGYEGIPPEQLRGMIQDHLARQPAEAISGLKSISMPDEPHFLNEPGKPGPHGLTDESGQRIEIQSHVPLGTDGFGSTVDHEVGHVLARHGNERVSQAFATQIGMAALSTAVKDPDNKWLMVAALGAQVGILLPFSRTHESEADMIGLDLMSRAGFDPSQSVELWKNMKAAGGGQPPEFLSTHPSNDRRIHDLQQGIPEANLKYRKAREAGHVPNCRL
jgi:hypothetical protein